MALPPSSPPPPPLPPPPPPIAVQLVAPAQVTTSDLAFTLALSFVCGAFFLIVWAIVRGPLRHIYVKRTQLPDAPARPPPLRLSGLLHRCFGYCAPVFLITDLELTLTSGLDSLMLCRFVEMGLQIYVPLTGICCAVLLPVFMTGDGVENNAEYANTASLMRWTMANLDQRSAALWVPFGLSYVVLVYSGWVLLLHYRSYAMLRLLHMRCSVAPAGGPPRQLLVGFEQRGWREVGRTLLRLVSAYHMHAHDAHDVGQLLSAHEAAFAADQQPAVPDAPEPPAVQPQASQPASQAGTAAPAAGAKGVGEDGDPVVLPWWLAPENVPAAVSAEYGTTGVLACKSSCLLRNRTLAVRPGFRLWAPASLYAVLFTVAGPPPRRELRRLLRSGPAVFRAASVVVDGDGDLRGSSKCLTDSSSASLALSEHDAQRAGSAADATAAQLAQGLQALFPDSFDQLVRVYNHKAVDLLLVKHEAAASQRDRCVTALAAARALMPAEGAKGGARAAARLARAEAQLAKWQQATELLEQQFVEARQAALSQPLGTAFIALFRTVPAAAMLSHLNENGAAVLPAGNFHIRPCPGPDNINWPALWATWQQRAWRGVIIMLPLGVIMLFPIGVITGALSNLDVAVCGGTPDTNSLYWPWYCNTTSLWEELVKGILQGILPAIISTFWDTYCLPLMFYALSERRHFTLSGLDRRITILFFVFNIINTFMGSVLGGAAFQQAGALIKNPDEWLSLVGTALPSASSFFLNYILMHAIMINVFRFLWPHDGTVLFVLFRAVGLFRPKCERDVYMIRTAPSYRAGRHFGAFLLIQVMALSYAVIAPLVLPSAIAYFFTAWLAWRYCALYFYERSYEAAGRIFETLFACMVWTLVVFSLFSAIVLASKHRWDASMIMVCTQLPALYLYYRNVMMSVSHYGRLTPLQGTLEAPTAAIDPATFLPPPLRKGAVGWYPEWGKVWEKYGIGRYTL